MSVKLFFSAQHHITDERFDDDFFPAAKVSIFLLTSH